MISSITSWVSSKEGGLITTVGVGVGVEIKVGDGWIVIVGWEIILGLIISGVLVGTLVNIFVGILVGLELVLEICFFSSIFTEIDSSVVINASLWAVFSSTFWIF